MLTETSKTFLYFLKSLRCIICDRVMCIICDRLDHEIKPYKFDMDIYNDKKLHSLSLSLIFHELALSSFSE